MDLNQYIGKTKGVLTIVSFDETELLKTNQKEIIANCKCSRCGEIVKVHLDRIVGKYKLYQNACKNCKGEFNIEQAKSKVIGNTYGVLTVISFEYKKRNRLFFKCKCNRCGQFTIVRYDRFTNLNYYPQSCEHCYYSLLGEKSLERCMKFHGFDNKEEYILDKIFREKIKAIKRGANDRNISYKLSDNFARALLVQNCYYCNEPYANGIDRINSNEGYIESNVVPCCGICNIMKNAFSQEVFYDKIDKIYNNRLKISSTTIESASKDESELSTSQAEGDGNAEDPKGS